MSEKKLKGKLIIKNKDKYTVFNNEIISKERKEVLKKKYE